MQTDLPSEVVVDGRWLEPPEPMEKVLMALHLLRPGQHVRLLIHRQPMPLYGLLEQTGYAHRTRPIDDGCYEVQIEPLRRDPHPSEPRPG